MYSRIKVTFSLLLYQQSFYTVSSTTYVKMYIYIYVNTHIYIYTNTNTYTYTYIRPTPQKGGFAPPRPVKITKTCGAQQGKVDFNPL